MPRRTVLILSVLLAIAGCGPAEETPWWSGIHDLTGVAASPELARAQARALAADAGGAPPPHEDDLALYEDLLGRIRPRETREAAGDEIYALWAAEPRHVLWLELAKNYDFLLQRRDDLEAMCARPGLDDPSTPFGAYVAGRMRFRHGDRGELYRRAEAGADSLDPLARVWLQYKLSEVDSEGGDVLAGVRRVLDVLPEARTVGGPRLEAIGWHRAARLLTVADRLDDALHAAATAGALQRDAGAEYALLLTRIRLADIRTDRREYRSARDELLALADEAKARRFHWPEQRALDDAAAVTAELGEYDLALEIDRRSLARARVLGDPLNLPRALASVAHDHRMLGDLDSCRTYLMEAKAAIDAYGDPRNVSRMNSLLAEFHCLVGEYDTADSLLAAAAGQSSVVGTANDEARILLELMPSALEMGRADLAYRWLDRLDEISGAIHDRGLDENQRADHQIASLRLLAQQGEFRRAATALAAAEAMVDVSGGEGKAWEVSAAAGELALLRGDLVTAEAAYRRCLDLAATGSDPDLIARGRRQLGQVLLARGEAAAARPHFLPQEADTSFGHRFSNRLHNLLLTGESHLVEGDVTAARVHFARALEMTGPHTPADLLARAELGRGRALAAGGEPREALAALERARDALAAAPGRATIDAVTAYLADDERRLRVAYAGLLHDHPELAGGAAAPAVALAMTRPAFADLPAPAPGAPRLVLLVGAARSFVWVVTDVGTSCTALPGRQELRNLLAPVVADLATPGREVDGRPAGRLAGLLLEPLRDAWQQGAVLTVVPDDLLHGVPWSALPWPAGAAEALVLDHGPVAVAAAAPARRPRRDVPAGVRMLALGADARPEGATDLTALRHAEDEARRVAALWTPGLVTLRLGEEASLYGPAAEGLGRYRVIHVATHATVHQGLPGRSTLRFAAGAPGEPLTIPAVGRLDVDAELVYLSCCHAGRQLGSRGSGATDFAAAFLQAGARSVVASTLWVDDEAAAVLAEGFYRYWLAGWDKADALWAARRELRTAREEWRHPAYWAFTRLVGAPD